MNGLQLADWLTIGAILLGPLIGIWVTRIIDRAKEREKRREAVFEGLMKTRGLELSPEHVGSLNMVPLLFQEQPVRFAYSRLMEILNGPSYGSSDEQAAEDAFRKLDAAKKDLLRAIGHAVRMPLPENEHERSGYAPSYWQRAQVEQDHLRSHLIEWLEGKRTPQFLTGVWELPPQPRETESSQIVPEEKKQG